jgi:hypothetical protein
MKVHYGFPPRLDCLSVEERGTKVYLRSYRNQIIVDVSHDGKTLVNEWVPLKTLVAALQTIPPQPQSTPS